MFKTTGERGGIRVLAYCAFAGVVAFAAGQWHFAASLSETRCGGKTAYVLVGFDRVPGAEERAVIEAHGGEVLKSFWIAPAICALVPVASFSALESHPAVRYLEADASVSAPGMDSPPTASVTPARSWGALRVGSGGAAIAGWETGAGVAVLDGGIDASHPALNVMTQGTTTNHYFDNPFRSHLEDNYGGGAHVAGIIAGHGEGAAGIAPNARLYSVRVLANGFGSHATVVAGIQWAIEHDVPIIHMGFTSYAGAGRTLQKACDAAYDAGHLLIAPAGTRYPGMRGRTPSRTMLAAAMDDNAGRGPAERLWDTVAHPARYKSVIAVTGSGADDNVWKYSAVGPDVELIAPAEDVPSTLRGGGYGSVATRPATASAHVAGAAALIWAANPDLTNDEVRAILHETAEDLGLHEWKQGHGLVRADRAAAAATQRNVTNTAAASASW